MLDLVLAMAVRGHADKGAPVALQRLDRERGMARVVPANGRPFWVATWKLTTREVSHA